MSRREKLTFINFCATNLCAGCFYSLLGPFFPTEAVKKGLSTTVIGFLFGMFELTIVVVSPIYGTFLTRVGAKFMYVTGVMVCGAAAILFGFLDESPDGVVYAVMCFAVRFVEALGAAALLTSSFAIIANTFPDRVATMFGTLESFSGIGMMIGPPVGGALFEAGGFKLPFISLGSALLLVGFISNFVLPSQNVTRISSQHSMFSLVKIPVVGIMCVYLMCGSGAIGFLDIALSIYLEKQYNLSPVILGLVFLVGPGVYALAAPVWGWIVDKKPRLNKAFLCVGYTLGGLGFYFLGPAPFLQIPHMLSLVLVCMALLGLGIGTLVIAFQVITEATMDAGYPDGLATFGLISGIFNTFFSLGAFVGPLGGGYLQDKLGFEMAAVVIGSFSLFAVLLLLLYMCLTSTCKRRTSSSADDADSDVTRSPDDQSERQPLLSDGHVPRVYSHDERLLHNDGRQGDDVAAQPNTDCTVSQPQTVEYMTTSNSSAEPLVNLP